MVTVEERLQRLTVEIDRTLNDRVTPTPSIPPPYRRVGLALATATLLATGLAAIVIVAGPGGHRSASDTAATTSGSSVGGWSAFTPPPIAPRFQHAAVATDNGIFVWGGCCQSFAGADSDMFDDGAYFDAARGEWRILPDAPLDDERGDAVAAWNGSEVIVLNGSTPIRAAAFDPATFSWRTISSPDAEGAWSTVSRLYPISDGRVVFVVSGYTDRLGEGVRVHIYDPATDTWRLAAMPRQELSYGVPIPDRTIGVGLSGDTIGFVSIGADACGQPILDVYDIASDSWTVQDLAIEPPEQAWSVSAIAGIDAGRFLLLGGPCSEAPQRQGVIIDPSSGTTTPVAETPIDLRGGYRYALTWTGEQVIKLNGDGRLLAYAPMSDTWATTPPIPASADVEQPDVVDDIPIVWNDGQVVVPSVAFGFDQRACCQPDSGAWSYRLP